LKEWIALAELDENETILKAIRSLRSDDPLRLQAQALLAEPGSELADVDTLLQPFGKGKAHRRHQQDVAAWIIQSANLSEFHRNAIAEKLSALLDVAEPNYVASHWVFACAATAMICLSTLSISDSFSPITVMLGSAVMFLLAISGAAWDQTCRFAQAKQILWCLAHLGHPGSLGSISAAFNYGRLRSTASSALAAVTANLRPEHLGTAPGDTIYALSELLARSDSATALVILKALTFIGDGRAISAVERLAKKAPTQDVGKAASELLLLLHKRDSDMKASKQLLRASSAANDGKQLLRPASGSNADAPELLLRAADAEDQNSSTSIAVQCVQPDTEHKVVLENDARR